MSDMSLWTREKDGEEIENERIKLIVNPRNRASLHHDTLLLMAMTDRPSSAVFLLPLHLSCRFSNLPPREICQQLLRQDPRKEKDRNGKSARWKGKNNEKSRKKRSKFEKRKVGLKSCFVVMLME
jgi:hypothetical protein